MNTDLEYLKLAYEIAIKESTDRSTQNGAVLVSPNGYTLCSAANHFPVGVMENDLRWERPLKYNYVEHAERNVIYKAAKMGLKTDGATMYCPWFACSDCARAIIQAGIKKVIGHKFKGEKACHPDWLKTIAIALEMFDESGIEYEYIEGKIGGIDILRNGVIINP